MSKTAEKVIAQAGSATTIPEMEAALAAWDELMEDPAELTYENSILQSSLLRRLQGEAFLRSAEELGQDDQQDEIQGGGTGE